MSWKLERAKTRIHHINTLHVPPMQQINTTKTEAAHGSVRAWNEHREGYTQSPHHICTQKRLWLITITTAVVGPNIMLLVTAIPTSHRSCQMWCCPHKARPASGNGASISCTQQDLLRHTAPHSLPGGVQQPHHKLLGFTQQGGEQQLWLSKGDFCRRASRRCTAYGHRGVGGYACSVYAAADQMYGFWWGRGWQIHTERPVTSTESSLQILQQRLHFCCKYLEFKYKTSAVCYTDQLPANLISSSMATAISTMNVFHPAVFPPAGIHEKFCIRTNIKNTRARLDHFTGNRGCTWDCNVRVTLQKQQQ